MLRVEANLTLTLPNPDESSTTTEVDNAFLSFGLLGMGYCNQTCPTAQDQSCGGDLR